MSGVAGVRPEHRGWVIQVCRTCDRLAVWPYCEHRDQRPPEGAVSWCRSVDVVPDPATGPY